MANLWCKPYCCAAGECLNGLIFGLPRAHFSCEWTLLICCLAHFSEACEVSILDSTLTDACIVQSESLGRLAGLVLGMLRNLASLPGSQDSSKRHSFKVVPNSHSDKRERVCNERPCLAQMCTISNRGCPSSSSITTTDACMVHDLTATWPRLDACPSLLGTMSTSLSPHRSSSR